MPLTPLSNELILIIAENLDSQTDISAFVMTTVQFFSQLNNFLYQYNVKHHNASALLWAARHDQETTMQNSLNAGAHMPLQSTGEKRIEIDGRVDVSRSRAHPIPAAAAYGSMSCLWLLLELGIDPDLQDGNSDRPLPKAAAHGHVEAVKLLVAHGADALSAMGPAAGWGHGPVLKALFSHLDSKNVSKMVVQEALWTVLQAGTRWGRLSAVEYALSKGADVNYCPPEQRHSTPSATDSEVLEAIRQTAIREGPSTFWSPRYPHVLHEAVVGGNEVVVRLVLQHGADINRFGGDALVQAICDRSIGKERQLKLIELLLKRGVDVNVHHDFWNPMDYAIAGRNEKIIQALKSWGAFHRILFQPR